MYIKGSDMTNSLETHCIGIITKIFGFIITLSTKYKNAHNSLLLNEDTPLKREASWFCPITFCSKKI